MPLVDPSILARLNTGSVLPAAQQGIQMGQGLIQFGQQQKTYQHQQDFQTALDEVVNQAGDFTTPEAHQQIIQGLKKRGFGAEAMDIEKKLQEMTPQPKVKTYQSVETDQGMVPFDTEKGTYGTPAQVNGKPLMKPIKPTEPKNPDSKVGEDHYYYNWNPATNRWDKTNLKAPQDDKPKGGLTDSQTATILNNIAHRADNDKDLGILQRRDNFYTTAKTAYDQYQNAAPETKDEARRQADQQIIFSLAKMRDEGVVMPGEFLRETAGQGWINSAINKVVSGATSGLNLSDTQRKFAVDLMSKFREQSKTRAKPRYDFYKRQGAKYGDPEYATGQWANYFEDAAPGAPSAPSAATSSLPTHEQYDSLPSGAEYTDPQGNVRRKK